MNYINMFRHIGSNKKYENEQNLLLLLPSSKIMHGFTVFCVYVFWKFLQYNVGLLLQWEIKQVLFICFSTHSLGRRQKGKHFHWLLCLPVCPTGSLSQDSPSVFALSFHPGKFILGSLSSQFHISICSEPHPWNSSSLSNRQCPLFTHLLKPPSMGAFSTPPATPSSSIVDSQGYLLSFLYHSTWFCQVWGEKEWKLGL